MLHRILLSPSDNRLDEPVAKGGGWAGLSDWLTARGSLLLQTLLCIYCSGQAAGRRNERADRLASTADITSGLQLGRAEVIGYLGELCEHGQAIALRYFSPEGRRSGGRKRPTFYPGNDLCSKKL